MHDVPVEALSNVPFRAAESRPAAMDRAGTTPRTHGRTFHVWMSGVFAVIAFAGFFASYWAKLASGTFNGAPIFHIHGAVFFAWIAFYFVQTVLAASGRISNHRAWGMAGIALFSVMICTTVALGIRSMQAADLVGLGDRGREFAIVTFTGLALVAGLFTAAVANIRRPDVHKRLMLVMMTVLVQPAIARLCALLLAPPGAAQGPPPLIATVPVALLADILILAAMVYDWRTRGRPHSTYVWAGAVVLAVQIARIPLAHSDAWMSVAGALQRLMG